MGPNTSIQADYLMTVYVPLEPPQKVSDHLHIYSCRAGGWVWGPHIKGEIIAPAADWLRMTVDGPATLDVRLSILADDGSLIYMTYGGRIATRDRLRQWPIPAPNGTYFLTNPLFETASKKYGWLIDIVCIGKDVAAQMGKPQDAMYDIFVLR